MKCSELMQKQPWGVMTSYNPVVTRSLGFNAYMGKKRYDIRICLRWELELNLCCRIGQSEECNTLESKINSVKPLPLIDDKEASLCHDSGKELKVPFKMPKF